MFDVFPDGPVYEYPQAINILYSYGWAFVLASIIAITHRLTTGVDHYPKNFFQSLILGSIVTTMVMMAIGDSLARGLGVFGAMAIIRFRTRIEDPRDVLFLFAALSTGLAVGVYGFTISFLGTVLFCAAAVVLRFSPFRVFGQPLHLYFTADSAAVPQAVKLLTECTRESQVMGIRVTREQELRYHYTVALKKGITQEHLMSSLRSVAGVKQVRIGLPELVNT
jgi:uncharacterized membrane protein YhiD involved in acid resistance